MQYQETDQFERVDPSILTSDVLPRPVVLLPLKLEIRYLDENLSNPIAYFDNSSKKNNNISNNINKSLKTKVKTFSKKESQYWIRWYPDDIHVSIPIGKLTDEEKSKWSVYKSQYDELNSDSKQTEGPEEGQIRNELKKLIDEFFIKLKQALVELIKLGKQDKNEKSNLLNNELSNLSKSLLMDLSQILENKDRDEMKIVAFANKNAGFLKSIKDRGIELIEDSKKLNQFNSTIDITKTNLDNESKVLIKSSENVNIKKQELNRRIDKYKTNILEASLKLIDEDISQKTKVNSTNTINKLTEELVERAIEISQPVEKREAKKREIMEFLKTREKDENTFYVEMVERLLGSIDIGMDREAFIEIVEMNSVQMEETFGAVRARQLAKNMMLNYEGKSWNYDTNVIDENSKEINDPIEILMEKGIQIQTLPNYLVLYTIKDGNYQQLLNDPIKIKKDKIFISPNELNESHWLTDFKKAISLGMGVKITKSDKVTQIKEADWLIAVGFSNSENIHSNLEEIFKRRNTAGQLSIVAQDSPTNNTENSKSPHTELETDIIEYFKKTKGMIPSLKTYNGSISEMEAGYSDAHILTNVLKFDPNTLGEIEGSDLREQNEATSINMLLWDACISGFKGAWTDILKNSLPDWKQFSSFFLENVRARGNFPAIKVGDNPYGILPVMSLKNWEPVESIGENAEVLSCIKEFCIGEKDEFLSIALGKKDFKKNIHEMISGSSIIQVPTLGDGNEDNSFEDLLEILRTTRVSQGLNVRMIDANDIFNMDNDPMRINCPLVKDFINQQREDLPEYTHSETAYLHHLSEMHTPLNLNDFIEKSPIQNPPVLKRLIYYLLEHPELIERIVPDLSLLKVANILKRVHPDNLEILLMEFLDLLSYRLDAWITGLAHERLIKYFNFEQEEKKPFIGVYGWLEKPGGIQSNTAMNSEYIQAPSQAQAVTAALLRNASMLGENDDPTGQFRINLSSDQIRKGKWYFDGLRQNHSPEELLGYQFERAIHKNAEILSNLEELDIYKLRKAFPLKLQSSTLNEDDEITYVETVINGEALLEAEINVDNDDLLKVYEKGILAKKINAFKTIQDEVSKTYDAAADMAVAEVLYQFLRGNTTRTGAWLDFLDGETLPPKPEFIQGHRTGDRHGSKVFLIVDPPVNIDEIFEWNYEQIQNADIIRFPRKIAAPIVTHFCESVLGDLSNSIVNVRISLTEDDSSAFSLQIPLNELEFKAIDLIIGGEKELEIKMRYFILQSWRDLEGEDDPDFDLLGPYPWDLKPQEKLNKFSIEITLDDILIKKANLLRKILHQNTQYNQEVSATPSKELKILTKENLQDINLFKTIEILIKRGEVFLKRLGYLIDYFQDIFNNQIMTQKILKENLDYLEEFLKTEIDENNTHQLWREIASEIDEIRLILQEMDVEIDGDYDLEIEYLEKIDMIIDLGSDQSEYTNLITHINNLDIGDYPVEQVSEFQDNLQEASQYGYYQAMTPFPNCSESLKILNNILDGLVTFLIKKRDNIIDIFKELTNTIDSSDDPWNDKNGWDYGDNSEHPAIEWLNNLKLELNENKEDWNEKLRMIRGTQIISRLISIFQGATDGKKLMIFTPYVLSGIKDWTINFDAMEGPFDESILENYKDVRSKIKDALNLFEDNDYYKFYEDENTRPSEREYNEEESVEESEEEEYHNTDFLYIAPFSGTGTVKCLCNIYIDDWVEFFPNMIETTGIAYSYDAPQSEAPNAILIAAPSKFEVLKPKSPDSLAQTILETIELMQIRMVGSEQIISSPKLGKLFPALRFDSSNIGKGKDYHSALFPHVPLLLCSLLSGSSYFYTTANLLNQNEMNVARTNLNISSNNSNSE